MARRGAGATRVGAPADLDAALLGLSNEALREVVHEVLLELDDRTRARVAGAIIARAARAGAGFTPAALSEDQVFEVLAFVRVAVRAGEARPSQVDEYLGRGSSAFLRRDYRAAHRIFGALLPPISRGEIYLGQDELVDEVLGVNVAECAAQYAVSAYMTAPAEARAESVYAAIEPVWGLGNFFQPLQELERVALEPLPDLAGFLPRWRGLIAQRLAAERPRGRRFDEERWLSEVVKRLEGAGGLAEIARKTKSAEDLRAWCRSLVEAQDWRAALLAFSEAAELITDADYLRGEFLDGAAVAARQLGDDDLPGYLERAWRGSPSLPRLRRWLGIQANKALLIDRATIALAASPRSARQRALLHVLLQDLKSAAELLADASGLGWSNDEHPGRLAFPLFAALLGGGPGPSRFEVDPLFGAAVDLATPTVEALLEVAGVGRVTDPTLRQVLLAAMTKAAEARIAGLVSAKRRKHYGQAAELLATCVACDPSGHAARWAASLRETYRYFPALRAEIDRALAAR